MRKALRIILWIVGGVFFLIFLAVIFINTRPGKNFIREKAVAFLQDKLKTEVHVGDLDYQLPKMIVLKDVLLRDQAKDTLLAAKELKVDIAMLKLINSNVSVQEIYLDGAYANIYRLRQDTVFNFDYIVKAFVSQGKDTVGKVEDTTARLQMNVDKLVLHNVRFNMNDEAGGSKMYFDIGDLNLTMKEVNPEKLIFRANKLYANNIKAVIIQDTSYLPEKPDTSTGPLNFQIDANELNLNNIYYSQQSLTNQFFMDVKAGKLLAHPQKIDIPNQSIEIKDFLLENSAAKILMAARAAELAEQVPDTIIQENAIESEKWRVSIRDLNLNNIGFVMDNENNKPQPAGIDYAHLNVQNLVLDADDINYTTDTIAGTINQLSAKEKSGLDIQKLKTRFEYNPQGGVLNDLYLQTSNTILQHYAAVKYPSLEAISKNSSLMQMEIHLDKSIIGMKDLLIFAPQLTAQPFFRKHRNGMLQLAADLTGRMDALNIEKLFVSGLGNTEVNLRGTVYGAPDPGKLGYNLNITKLQSSRNDLETLLPPSALKQIRLPDRFGITGTISGTASLYRPDLMIITTDGNAAVRGTVDMSHGTGRERYHLALKTRNLNVGRIIRNPELGRISADLAANGQSFDINRMNARMKGRIHAAGFNNYTYRSINFDGNIARKKAKINLDSNDPNAHLSLTGNADLSGKYPAVYADATIDSVDLKALNFYQSEMRIHGIIHADIPELNTDYPRATITIEQPVVTTNGERYFLDSLYIVSRPSADSGNNIVINAQALHAKIWGHTPLTKTGDIIQQKINQHYALSDSLPAKPVAYKNVPADYDLNLIAKVEDHPVLQGFLPGLKDFDTVRIEGGLSPGRLFLNADAPKIVYNAYNINDAKIRVSGSDSALVYQASVDHFYQKSMDVWYANISGNLSLSTITSRISIADKDSNQKFRIHAIMQQNGQEQVLQLQPGLMLDYKTWDVNQPNKIVFAKEGFYIQNFGISNGPERISVNSESPHYNAPLKATISSFLLSNITHIISKDTLLANGVLGGEINLKQLKPSPQIASSLEIENLSVLGDTIGNMAVNVKNATENEIDAQVGITGNGNDVSLKGAYFLKPVNGNEFDMMLTLNPLNVAAFEGAAQHQIKNTSGYIRGNLKITGAANAPSVNGELITDQLSTNVAMLNAQFTMPHETIGFQGQNIALNNFTIQDSANNRATINGNFDYKNMNLAMNLRANNWLAVSSTPKENKDFYGRLLLSTQMNVNGPVTAPNVDGSLNVLKGTSFTVTIPSREPGLESREGIVKFVDMSSPVKENLLLPAESDSVKRTAKMPVGSSVNVNVSTDEEAEFSVIIDEGTGDFVRIRGKANLNTYVMPDGTLGLTGTYEIVDGQYHFSYNFIRRDFRVQPGSTITFAGDPTKADLNVTAIYEANVPPYDLVSRQVQDPAELVYFKQKLPFQVQMKLTGEMMKPEIGFNIVLPEEKNYAVAGEVTDLVQARLTQLRTTPSDLNKQVFALIILNRFVSEDPFQNGAGGGGAEAIARQSVSRFLSEQLNKFASGLIAGLDLTLDLNTSEDYTTGERRNRTDLNVGASKRLLNDRLTINVGNNFQLEGPQSNSTNGTSFIPGNISIDYALTADRRYKVRFFRRDEEVGAAEGGDVISTGASFIMQVDYNRFRNVLMSRKKRRELMQERRKERKEERRQNDTLEAAKAVMFTPRNEENPKN